jgi:hypothetical protein
MCLKVLRLSSQTGGRNQVRLHACSDKIEQKLIVVSNVISDSTPEIAPSVNLKPRNCDHVSVYGQRK